MGYLEIIGIGFLFNFAGLLAIITISILMSIIGLFTKDMLVQMEEAKALQIVYNELKELQKDLPYRAGAGFLDYGKWFPFGFILPLIHFIIFATIHGPTIYMINKISKRIERLEAYKESLNEN